MGVKQVVRDRITTGELQVTLWGGRGDGDCTPPVRKVVEELMEWSMAVWPLGCVVLAL